MSSKRPTRDWRISDIDKMLELLAIMESPDFVAFVWIEPQPRIEAGVQTMQIPYPDYHPVVTKLVTLLYNTSAYIDPYTPLPEDSMPNDGTEVWHYWTDPEPETFSSATLNQVRRYLVLCTRGERFCEGHIASQFESGALHAALSRLAVLRLDMK